jgi:hypothetical protein
MYEQNEDEKLSHSLDNVLTPQMQILQLAQN